MAGLVVRKRIPTENLFVDFLLRHRFPESIDFFFLEVGRVKDAVQFWIGRNILFFDGRLGRRWFFQFFWRVEGDT